MPRDRDFVEEMHKYGVDIVPHPRMKYRPSSYYTRPLEACWTMQTLFTNGQLETLLVEALRNSLLAARRIAKKRQKEAQYTSPAEEIGFFCTEARRQFLTLSKYPGMADYCKRFMDVNYWATPGVLRTNHFDSYWRLQVPSSEGVWDLTKERIMGYCARALSQALAIENGSNPGEAETVEDSFREMEKLLEAMRGNVAEAEKINTEADSVCDNLCKIAESIQR